MNNKIFDKIILSTSYFPPIEYFFAIENSKEVFIESKEIYQKQSYRTRCEILSCNGPLILNIPVLRDKESGHKLPISEIKIDYSTNWLSQHKRALEAAYKSSPFYEYYIDDINNILDKNFEYLFDLNNALNKLILELLGITTKVNLTCSYQVDYIDILDLRAKIHPKLENKIFKIIKPYWQVFMQKQGFVNNLSILDLLFNEGPNSISYLKSKA